MGEPKSYHFKLKSLGRPEIHKLDEEWYPGVEKLWGTSSGKRPGDPIDSIVAIVIHATAGSSSAGAMSVMKGGNASWHWLVPDENEEQHGHFVWACTPEKKAAWHVRGSVSHADVNGGKKSVNGWSLGVEVVNAQVSDPFSAWQVEATARIVRYCWAKYPNLKDVVSHAKLDPTRRTDPGTGFDWDRFKDLVLNGANGGTVNPLVALARPVASLTKVNAASCCGT